MKDFTGLDSTSIYYDSIVFYTIFYSIFYYKSIYYEYLLGQGFKSRAYLGSLSTEKPRHSVQRPVDYTQRYILEIFLQLVAAESSEHFVRVFFSVGF